MERWVCIRSEEVWKVELEASLNFHSLRAFLSQAASFAMAGGIGRVKADGQRRNPGTSNQTSRIGLCASQG